MIFYPAIDLKEGRCVRLVRGEMATATVFNADPAAQAEAFVAAGAEWLHIVDLDGAFAGKPVNSPVVKAILARATIPVQLGGGIRSRERIDFWLGRGVSRVILGTAALRDPDLVVAACRDWPGASPSVSMHATGASPSPAGRNRRMWPSQTPPVVSKITVWRR